MAGKFNLTELLNQRSKEQTAAAVAEESTGTAVVTEEAPEAVQGREEIKMIDVYDLIPSKDNFYRVDDSLKRSIELVGVLQPLLVKQPENGKYRVIAGHRRRLAVLALVDEGNEERRFVPCVFKKEDIRDRLAIIMANRFRDKTDWEKMKEAIEAEELARELKTEFKLQGRTREVLAEITGVSEAQLGRYKAVYNNLNEQLMAEFRENNIGFSVVSEVCGLPEEWQQQAAEKFMENGILTLPDVKELKRQEEASRDIPGQMKIEDIDGQENTQEAPQTEENADGEEITGEEEKTAGTAAGEPQNEEYTDPEPETVTSLCYSCDKYEDCHEKKSTVTSCNAYVNRKEARKTDEQRYNEEQNRIDRETKKKLQEQQDAAKMERLPGDEEQKRHEVTISSKKYDDIQTGKLEFLLMKQEGYKVGEEMPLIEFKDGQPTGRQIDIVVKYVCEGYTGLEDGYCILGFDIAAIDV